MATTASYQVSFEGFGADGVDRAEVERLLRRSVALAAAARDDVAPGGWVAASVGPYGAVLADGSEYRGDYDLDVAALRAFHRPRLDVLASTVGDGADVLAIETVPCLAEVEAVLAELDGTGVPAWLSLSAADGRTRAGEPLEEAFAMAADVAEVIAVGVNCTTPADAGAAVGLAGAHGPAVVYPNSGQAWDADAREWQGRSAFAAADVSAWVDAGRTPGRRMLPRGPRGHLLPAGRARRRLLRPEPVSAGEDDQPLGGARHRHVAVDRAGDAVAEPLGVDQHDQVELQALGELGGQPRGRGRRTAWSRRAS